MIYSGHLDLLVCKVYCYDPNISPYKGIFSIIQMEMLFEIHKQMVRKPTS
jgi:hypothetical protein